MNLVFMIEHYLLLAIQIYSWVLIIYILMSWFPNARESSFGRFLGSLAEPYLEPFRRIIPPFGMIDFSPIVAFLVLNWLVPRGVHFLFTFFY
ncbi:MAG TPA: YggT family protein [Bacillales bacterium]|nr:YggT family protein [Bacillales bacterium]